MAEFNLIVPSLLLDYRSVTLYQEWLNLGNEGTMADFIAWLRTPATEAAAQALQAAAEALAAAQTLGQGIAAAEAAATLANTKAVLANDAALLANEKAALVDSAATLANTKAGLADAAAILATEKAILADSKATLANNKAVLAQSAADNANAKAAEVTAAVLSAGQLGPIKPTDSAPTPARNGNYTLSSGGNKPAWLTAEPLVTEVKAGDGVAVVYTAPDNYSYTHVDVSSDISSLKEFVVNGGNITATDETLLTSDQSNYGLVLANTFPTSGNQWFSEQNKVNVATNLVSVKTKVSSIGNVIVYDFDPIAKTVTAIGTFTAAALGWQSFTLPSPVAIASGHYVGTSNTTYITGGARAQKLVISGGVVSSFVADYVELCQTIATKATIPIKGLRELNEEIINLSDTVNSITEENGYIRLFQDLFSNQDSANWNFAGTWTTESNGIKPSAIGNTNYVLSKRIYHSDKRFMRMRVLMGANTKLMLPVVFGGTINSGEGASCFSVDFANKKLIIYSVGAPDNQATANGYTTTELNTTVIPDNVIGAREYIIELHKDGTNHILRLFDTLTGEKVEVSHNGWAAGRQNQYYGFYVDSGALPTLINFQVWSLNKPDVVFSGDSITEGVMVIDRTRRYAEQFRTDNPNKKIIISARGGDTIDGILAKFATEYNIYKPKKLSVLIGANPGNNLAKLHQLKANCEAINCTLILNYRTCQYATNTHIDGNTLISQIGVNGARFDIATALNNNPIGATDGTDSRYNPALYYDGGLHPNNDGNDKMYNRLIIDVPELYYY